MLALLRAASALALAAGIAFSSPASAAERIRSFATDIELSPHDEFRVVETIEYDFGAEQRHGIFRRIPVRYGRGAAADYSIGLDVETVDVRDDARGWTAEPFEVRRDGRDVVVRIGDPDRFVSGRRAYRLSYRVRRGILYFDEHDEVYWNATGNEWDVPIDAARATLRLPTEVIGPKLRLGCFTGPQGAVEHDCTVAGEPDEGTTTVFVATRPLAPREGLTIVAGLPKGALVQPSALERLWSRALDWWSALYAIPLGTLAVMTLLWSRGGRDPDTGRAVAVRYEPPEGMTPAEMGTVLDESADMDDITATILDLAVRGHLRIVEKETARFLFLTSRDYELVRVSSKSALTAFEQQLLYAIFSGRGASVRVSELKDEFYKKLGDLEKALYDATIEKHWFASSPQKTRTAWQFGGVACGIAAVLALVMTESFANALPLALTAAIVLVFARAMPRRTSAGRRAYEEILGFKEFVERVDRDRLERSGGRDADRFERVLPYAVVLGVADEWAEAFADVYTKPPSWYSGSNQTFRSRSFVSDLGQSMRTLGTAMASRPNRGGSGSSGFGGGGSSGGGFGGGGGGSW